MAKLLFRADGNLTTGLGHLYRLFALVEMFKENYDIVFVTKKNSVLSVIPTEYRIEVIPNTIDLINEPEWLFSNFPPRDYIIIADGYQFISSYQKEIKVKGYNLIYIDDLAKEHMYADIVVNHSPHITKSDYKKENYTKLFLGTDYALLRPSFLRKEKKIKKVLKLDTAFVCFGGADEFDFTYKFVKELLSIPTIKKINVVVGGAYQFTGIYELEKLNSKVEVFKNLDENRLYNLMNMCTFGITPTSTILFELISVKMYLVSGFYVENQEKAYYELNKRNIFKGVGNFNKYKFNMLKNHLLNVSPMAIQNQIESQGFLIDKNQKNRFMKLIKKLK